MFQNYEQSHLSRITCSLSSTGTYRSSIAGIPKVGAMSWFQGYCSTYKHFFSQMTKVTFPRPGDQFAYTSFAVRCLGVSIEVLIVFSTPYININYTAPAYLYSQVYGAFVVCLQASTVIIEGFLKRPRNNNDHHESHSTNTQLLTKGIKI